MITTQILRILPLIALIECSYPSNYYGNSGAGAGGNRYNYGTGTTRRSLQWSPYRPVIRTQRNPVNYYTVYPYRQSYIDDYYYPQETYPVYYPRTSKYDMILPTYYQKPGHDGYYYDLDPLELQEEMLQEVEREEREDAQPIGHEKLYENEDYTTNFDNYDKTSVANFQKLLEQKNKNQQYDDYNDQDYQNEWQDIPATKLPPLRQKEDKEVQDLRKLKYKPKNYYNKRNSNKDNTQTTTTTEYTNSVQKTQFKKEKDTTTVQPISIAPKKNIRGQKEVVMMRPATPVKNPFSSTVMNMMINNEEKKRSQSVFDTLKRMLEMEKNLKNKYGEENIRPAMKKRIISDEDSLIHQLSVLKKSK